VCHDCGELLAARRSAGDLARARRLLEEGLALAQALDMPPLSGRVTASLGRLPGVSQGGPSYPDGLSEREVEVIRLLAAGWTNKEIAGELFISVKTVANHLTNIFAKIGLGNRTELATYVLRRSLAKPAER